MEKFTADAINVCGSLSGVVATCKNEVWADRLAEALNAQEAMVAGDDPEQETLARFQAARAPLVSFGGVPTPIPLLQCTMEGKPAVDDSEDPERFDGGPV
jgi:hypothetical protein